MYRYLPLTILHLYMKYESCMLKTTQVIMSEPKCWPSSLVTLTFNPKMHRYLPLTILHLCFLSPSYVYVWNMKDARWKLLQLSCQNQSVDKVPLWHWPLTFWSQNVKVSSTHHPASMYEIWKLYVNKRPKGPLSLTREQWMHKKFDFGMEQQEAQRATKRAPEYNVPPFLMDWQGWPFLFTFRPEKHKLGRGRWTLTSCQVLLNSVQRFQRKSQNMSQSIRGQRGHIVFSISPKNTNLVEDIENLRSVKFRWIPFCGFKEVENVSANKRPGWLSCFSDRPEKRKPGRGCWDLASCQVSLNSVQRFQRKSRKCLSQSKPGVAILIFRSARKTQTW